MHDSELTMKRPVTKTVSTSFYHLRRLRQLRRYVDIDAMKQLVSAFIFSRLDYCNAVLYGLPQSTIGPMQRVLYPAALVASCSSYPVQGCAFDVYGTWQSLSRVSKRIRSTSQQQPSTSTSSFCQQPRLNGQELSLVTEPSLLPVWQYGTVCLSLSDQLRLLLVLSAGWKCWTFRFNWLISLFY